MLIPLIISHFHATWTFDPLFPERMILSLFTSGRMFNCYRLKANGRGPNQKCLGQQCASTTHTSDIARRHWRPSQYRLRNDNTIRLRQKLFEESTEDLSKVNSTSCHNLAPSIPVGHTSTAHSGHVFFLCGNENTPLPRTNPSRENRGPMLYIVIHGMTVAYQFI